MVNLARGFAELGARVTLVLASRTGEYDHLIAPPIEVVDLECRGVISGIPSLARFLYRERPSSMLVTLDHAAVAALLANRLAGSPTKMFVRQACTTATVERPTILERLLPVTQRIAYQSAERIIAVSNGVAEDVRTHLGVRTDRVIVIANPVLTADIEDQAQLPADHPWLDEKSCPVILAAGRLHRQKGFDVLLEAFAIVRKSARARLVILGEGRLRADLLARAVDLGVHDSLSLPGFVRNPFSFMRRADVFVLSSRWEGLPGVLLQAMSCGCPVVSVDCPSGPREILEDGKFGPLVPIDDPEALAAAILRVLDSPIAASVLRGATTPYAAHESAARYLDVLTAKREAGTAA